jgi:uncharacterized membrane protein YebE (DUF533 family)
VNDQNARYARLRNTATGALAALAAVGAIAGTAALAANPRANTHAHTAVANGATTKTPAPAPPGKNHTPPQDANNRFVIAVQRLVNDGTISTTEGQAVDREILAGSVDTQALTSSGFTEAQLQAVEQTLSNTKRAVARSVP